MTKDTVVIAVASLAIAGLVGCNAKPAVAPRADVQAVSDGTNLRVARSWPRKNIHIGPGGNKFFLWKMKTVEECPGRANLPIPGMGNPGGPTRPKLGPCPDDIAFVLNASNRAGDGLIALDDRTFLIQKEENAIRADVLSKNLRSSVGAPLGVEDLITFVDDGKCTDGQGQPQDCELMRDKKALDTVTRQQTTAKGQRKQKQDQLDAEQHKPQSEQDANLIAQLKRDIAALDTQIAGFQKRIETLTAQIKDITNAPEQVADNMLEGDLDTFRKDVTQRNDISAKSDAVLTQIKNAVDFYDYSDNLTVDFTFNDDGTIGVDVLNWDFRVPGPDGTPIGEEGAKSFSTADGTITDVSYVEMPGTFEFDVHAPDARYHFKVSHTRYGAADGLPPGPPLAHLQGEILRYSNDGSNRLNPRRGVAVMDEPSTAGVAGR